MSPTLAPNMSPVRQRKGHQPTAPIDFDTSPHMDPLLHDFLRDYTASHVQVFIRARPNRQHRLVKIELHATAFLPLDVDFPPSCGVDYRRRYT
jgi:hypothetical protein